MTIHAIIHNLRCGLSVASAASRPYLESALKDLEQLAALETAQRANIDRYTGTLNDAVYAIAGLRDELHGRGVTLDSTSLEKVSLSIARMRDEINPGWLNEPANLQ